MNELGFLLIVVGHLVFVLIISCFLSVYGVTKNSINLIWQKSNENDFKNYEIYISETNSTLGNFLISIDNKSVENYTAVNLKADTLYYFTMRVYDTYGKYTDSEQYMVRTSANPQPTNNPPELLDENISPETGNTGTTFRFTVIYKDLNGDKPTKIQIKIDNVSYDMEESDSSDKNYKDGKEYFYETTLDKGEHNYTFYASDGKLDLTMPNKIQNVEEKKETAKGFLPGFEVGFVLIAILIIALIRIRDES